MSDDRVAVLVDGDNVAPSWARHILEVAGTLGRVDLARVYGAANRPSGWHSMPGFRLVHAGTGKNAADVLLCIDAMEFAMTDAFPVYVIATSDGDFTHIAQRLRERRCTVIGIGEDKAPEEFRAACTRFSQLAAAEPPPVKETRQAPTPAPMGLPDIDPLIREMIAHHGKKGEGMLLTALSARMHAEHRVQISCYPGRTWRGYLRTKQELYDVDPKKKQDAKVRFRPEGFARLPR